MTNAETASLPSAHGYFHTLYQWRSGKALSWQVLGLLLVGAYISALHLYNDGLWYQGDAARHAANGVFWWDFLRHFPVDPYQFTLRYYTRYPGIHPLAYPPVFYLLEGAAFAGLGISPFVAKGLVLGFALVGCGYVIVWLRRWVAEEAGWGGILLMLQPGVILWSHTIMLNVPAMTVSLAALYYTRRWLEAPTSRYLYVVACLALVVPLTYVPAGVTLCVMLAWILAKHRWRIFQDRRVWKLATVLSCCLGPWIVLAMYWAPKHFALVFPNIAVVTQLQHWLYYAQQLPILFRMELLGTALLGIILGGWGRQWRHEIALILAWGVICYLGLSYIVSREARYALLLAPPAVILASSGLFYCSRWLAVQRGRQLSWVFLTAIALVLLLHLAMAHQVKVPLVKGFQEVFAFLNREAPRGYIFYDGWYDGIFSFYLRAQDSQFERGVVLGNKLLYASAIFIDWRLTERISSAAEVVEAFRQQCGCRWLVIARAKHPPDIAAVRYLYEALQRPEFELVQSFPMVSPLITHVDVYRFLLPALEPLERELPFPNLAPGTVLRAKPIGGGACTQVVSL